MILLEMRWWSSTFHTSFHPAPPFQATYGEFATTMPGVFAAGDCRQEVWILCGLV